MRSSAIVETEVTGECAVDVAGCLIGMQIDLLVFDAAPQALDEHVVDSACLAVHADRDVVGLEHVGELRGGELAALDALLFVK